MESEPVGWLLQQRTVELGWSPGEWHTEDHAWDKEWRDKWLSDCKDGEELRAVPLYTHPAEAKKPRNWKHDCEDWAMEGDACARCSPHVEPKGAEV